MKENEQVESNHREVSQSDFLPSFVFGVPSVFFFLLLQIMIWVFQFILVHGFLTIRLVKMVIWVYILRRVCYMYTNMHSCVSVHFKVEDMIQFVTEWFDFEKVKRLLMIGLKTN